MIPSANFESPHTKPRRDIISSTGPNFVPSCEIYFHHFCAITSPTSNLAFAYPQREPFFHRQMVGHNGGEKMHDRESY